MILSTRILSSIYTFFFFLYLTEIRNHGVGYYQFSTSEEQRQEQMKTLENLREQVRTGKQELEICYEHYQIYLGLCKTRTGWRRMADGKVRMTKYGWKNVDDKMRMQKAEHEMRTVKCG